MMLYLVIRPLTMEPAALQHLLPAHFAWLRHGHDSGQVLASGPTADGKTSIFILRTASAEAAFQLMEHDPLAAGTRNFQLLPWDVHQILGTGPFTVDAMRAIDAGKAGAASPSPAV